MFLTYLGRELRRRARQASIIALGLALGIGLVITVTALSSGVKNAQGEVLHSLYGQDTDITVSKTPTLGSGGPGGFSFRGAFGGGTGTRPKAGTKVAVDTLSGNTLGPLADSDVTAVSKLSNVAAVAGGLTLNDTKVSFTIPSAGSGGGALAGGGGGGFGFRGSGSFPSPISVDGVDLAGSAAALGPLSSAKLTSGRTLAASDATADVALVSSNYARSSKLTVGSTVTLAKTSFKVSESLASPLRATPQTSTSRWRGRKPSVPPLARALRATSTPFMLPLTARPISAASPRPFRRRCPRRPLPTRATWPTSSPDPSRAPQAWPTTSVSGSPSRCSWRRSCWQACSPCRQCHAASGSSGRSRRSAGIAAAWSVRSSARQSPSASSAAS